MNWLSKCVGAYSTITENEVLDPHMEHRSVGSRQGLHLECRMHWLKSNMMSLWSYWEEMLLLASSFKSLLKNNVDKIFFILFNLAGGEITGLIQANLYLSSNQFSFGPCVLSRSDLMTSAVVLKPI